MDGPLGTSGNRTCGDAAGPKFTPSLFLGFCEGKRRDAMKDLSYFEDYEVGFDIPAKPGMD
ncbi:hypothetical protein MWU54_17495, partial [Marivita sp. S6314]|uniref:hypothetical protein n=1 Tax=Marivita sp. S6314 TaxID=2926406 RepID=UPI001FF50EAF